MPSGSPGRSAARPSTEPDCPTTWRPAGSPSGSKKGSRRRRWAAERPAGRGRGRGGSANSEGGSRMKSIVRSAHRGLGPRPVGPPRPRARGLRGRPHKKKLFRVALAHSPRSRCWGCGSAGSLGTPWPPRDSRSSAPKDPPPLSVSLPPPSADALPAPQRGLLRAHLTLNVSHRKPRKAGTIRLGRGCAEGKSFVCRVIRKVEHKIRWTVMAGNIMIVRARGHIGGLFR